MTQTIGGFTDGEAVLAPRSYGKALFAAAQADDRIVCLNADLTQPTETYLMRDEMAERFFSIGIQEANMIGVAAGMARCGDIAFAHSFCVFATRRVYDQIAMQLAYPKTNVKVVGFIPGVNTDLGVSHQAIDDVALMRALPNMVIIEPCGPEQIHAAVQAAIAHEGPVYLRLSINRGKADESVPLVPLEIGKGQVIRKGTDLAILASGTMVAQAREAADALAAEGLNATVANISTLKPLDTDLVRRLADSHPVLITAENHSVIGGLGSAVAETLAVMPSRARLGMIGVQDCFAEGGSTPYLMRKYGLDAAAITAKARALCQGR